MTALATKNLPIYVTKAGATPKTLVPTAISKGHPAVVTVADTAGLSQGDVVKFTGTGFRELDGQAFVLGAVEGTAHTFEVLGADTTASTGIIATTGLKAVVHVGSDMVRLCLNQFDVGAPSVSTTDVSTYCGEASLPGATTPGSITLGGYVSKDDSGLIELMKAENDGVPRFLQIVLPGSPVGDNGYFVGEVTFSGLGYSVPLNGAVGFTVTGTQSTKFKWVVKS